MYEVELEFPEGWGALIKKSLPLGMDILWSYTMCETMCIKLLIINIHMA